MINESEANEFLDLSFNVAESLEPYNDELINGEEKKVEDKNNVRRGEELTNLRDDQTEIGEKTIGIKALEDYIKGISSEVSETNSFPLKGSGTIDMRRFLKREYLSKKEIEFVEDDLRRLREKEIEISEKDKRDARKKLGKGVEEERIEMMVKYWRRQEINFQKFFMAVMNKVVGNDFYICRASKYDDIVGGVDIFIADRKTEDIVCVIDMMRIIIAATGQERLFEKKKKIFEKNLVYGGENLNFFSLKGRKKRNIPIFCINFQDSVIRKSIDNFTPDLSNDEMRFFDIFFTQIKEQILELKDRSSLLPDLFNQRLDVLENQFLPKMKKKRKEFVRKFIRNEKTKKKQG